jgi:hypothetical protein
VPNSGPFGGAGGPAPENLSEVFNLSPFNALGFGGADQSPAIQSISDVFNAAPFNAVSFCGAQALNVEIVTAPVRRARRWFPGLRRPVRQLRV